MRINWDTPVSELYHSDSDIRYIELDEGELMHWKYIKREKVNGKWRYYYHDDDYQKAKNDYETKKKAAENSARRRDTIIAKNKPALDELNREHNERYGAQAGNNENWPKYFDKAKRYIEENNKVTYYARQSSKRAAEAEMNYKRAKSTYDKSAGHKVADFLNKSSDKISKATNWLSNLFKKKKKK